MSAKRFLPVLLFLALALALRGGLCEVWTGTTAAAQTEELLAGADGILSKIHVRAGQAVSAGETVWTFRETPAFAPFDGRVTAVYAEEGEETDGGLVMTIEPLSPYFVSCSVKKATRTEENTLVRAGQRVWIRCSKDGSHRAPGRVTSVDGLTFRVEALGGDLFVGESVFVFREGSFDDADKIGTGTVLTANAAESRAAGTVRSLAVRAGETVERGQLLYRTADGESDEVKSRCGGWVTEVFAAEGDAVLEETAVARVATAVRIVLETDRGDREALRAGTRLRFWRADDPHTLRECRVVRVLTYTDSDAMTVELEPEDGELLPVGISVGVTNER